MPRTMTNTPADIEAVSLLAEPIRGKLYEWVAGAGGAVGRDEAAKALRISRALAAFHLDRLVAAGLLVTEYRRLSGRSGPGAGRPSKLYRPATVEIAVSVPGRRYEVPARLFAETIEQLEAVLPPQALNAAARAAGLAVGAAARARLGRHRGRKRLREALLEALAERGYRPRETSGEIRFGNCPFRALVDDHRPLVCGMNLALVEGLVTGLRDPHLTARLDPKPELCCVAIGGPGMGH
jgi:predicted ArsR family transcriptional regulator